MKGRLRKISPPSASSRERTAASTDYGILFGLRSDG
jgi:hypothetical protein